MLEQRHGAFGHVRIYRPDNLLRLRRFCSHLRAGPLFQIGLWGKVSNWKSPLGGSLFWFIFIIFFCGGGGLFFTSNFKQPPLFTPHFWVLSFSPSFFAHCREIHYEAAPFFFVLPHWWRERRDRPSRIDNERGDWRWKQEEQKKREELKTDGKVERGRSRRRQRLGRQITKNRELTGIFQNPLGELESLSNLSVLCRRLVSAMGRGGVRIYTRGGTWAGD